MTARPLIKENYVKYLEGTLPIILSAPHGGVLKPKDIPNRTTGVFDIDSNTSELTHEILEEFFIQTNNYPYAIVMDLSRTKVDANRAIHEATTKDEKAIATYNTFHDFIKESKSKVDKKFKKGIYIDIHGQSHSHGHIEFGYLLFNDTLKLSDEEIEKHAEKSSIKTLKDFSDKSFVELLKGETSLSGLINKKGLKAMPSQDKPYDENGEYFEGAYNTFTYSSLDGSSVSSIQAEFPFVGYRDTKENRKKTAKAFVSSLIEYMKLHFGFDFKKTF